MIDGVEVQVEATKIESDTASYTVKVNEARSGSLILWNKHLSEKYFSYCKVKNFKKL